MLDRKTPPPEQAPAGPATPPKPDAGEWRVETTHGRTLVAPDLATLHRWIIERRVTREDRISQDAKSWQRVGDVAELVPFFDIVDSAERARRADTPGPMMLPAPPPYNSHPGRALDPVVLDRGAFPEVEDRTETKILRTGPSRLRLPLLLGLTTLVAALAAYAGISLINLRRAPPQEPVPAVPIVAAVPVTPPAAPVAAEEMPAPPAIEPLAEISEPKPEDGQRAEPSANRKRGRAARVAAARAAKAAGGARPAAPAPAPAVGGPTPQAMAAQGYAELSRRQFDQAIVHFKQALAGSPSNGTALFGLAEAYRETGQKGPALKAYRRYIQLLPSGPDAGSARLQIRLLEGKR